jgi:hypothetical protein
MRITAVFALALLPVWVEAQMSASTPTVAPQSESKHLEWTSEVLVSNNSVWRGFLSDRTPTIQPSVTLSVGSFAVTSTTALEFDGQYCWKEHDLELSYTKPLAKGFSLESGYINYAYPAADRDRFAHEFFSGISLEGGTGFHLQTFQQVGLSTGTYLNGGISHVFLSSSKFPALVEASIGYNRKLFIPEAAFSDAVVTVSTELQLRSGVSLSPQIGYSKGLNSRYFDDYLTAGLRFSYKPGERGSSER